jgi:hypothetical protein
MAEVRSGETRLHSAFWEREHIFDKSLTKKSPKAISYFMKGRPQPAASSPPAARFQDAIPV